MRKILVCFIACLMVLSVVLPQAWAVTNEVEDEQFSYEIEDGKAIINGRSVDLSGDVIVPGSVLGYPVVVSGFSHCDTIRSVTISNGAVGIDEYAFGASSIKEIRIPKSVTTIGQGAFLLCSNLESVVLPDEITSINDRLFNSCDNLVSVKIPNKVIYIGASAFSGCTKLEDVTIPESVTTIGERAFSACDSITSIVIPENVTTIGDMAFAGCDKLERIWVDPNNSAYSSDEYDVLYNRAKTKLITVPAGIKGEFTVPDSVTIMERYSFSDCTGLIQIRLPDNITVLEEGIFQRCSGLSKIVIPNKVTAIGDYAFMECTNLEAIVIPKSVQTIGADAFLSSGLKTVYYEGTEADWKNIDIKESVHVTEQGEEKLTNVKIVYNYSEKNSNDTGAPAEGNYLAWEVIVIGVVIIGVLVVVICIKRKWKSK